MPSENDGGINPTPVTAWQLIGGVISIVAVMVVALWTIVTYLTANEKAITDNLRDNYVTNSRHDDLSNRLNREMQRIDDAHKRFTDDLRRAHDDNMPRSEFQMWEKERTRTVDRLIFDQDKTTTRIEQVVRDRASVEATSALQRQIDMLSSRLEAISVREDQRHIIAPSKDK